MGGYAQYEYETSMSAAVKATSPSTKLSMKNTKKVCNLALYLPKSIEF